MRQGNILAVLKRLPLEVKERILFPVAAATTAQAEVKRVEPKPYEQTHSQTSHCFRSAVAEEAVRKQHNH
jgi:hypothetical protein